MSLFSALPNLTDGMIHPYTKETVQMFLRDGAKSTDVLWLGIPTDARPH